MANALTGDFDVVAQFSTAAVNRILAAMHQAERFLHSISGHVDDNPHPGRPTVVGVLDGFGDAVADQTRIGNPSPASGPSVVSDPGRSHVGGILNPDLLGLAQPPLTPSHISGNVQLQLFPPTVLPPSAAGGNLAVEMDLMARYFPDSGSAPLAEFIRGNLQISAPINKVASGRFHVLDIDFKAEDATITFTPTYSSQPLAPEDISGINLCIQNGLRSSFLPSSVVLPSSIADVQLRTLPGALAVLLNLTAHPSSPSSVTNVLLSGQDGFVFAAGRDYVLSILRAVADNILGQSIQDIKFAKDFGITTLHYDYPVALNSIDFDLSPSGHSGKIVMTIQATIGPEVHGHPLTGPYNPTITAELTLQPFGNTVEIGLGNVSVDPHSTAIDIVSFFSDFMSGSVRPALLNALVSSNANAVADQIFNTDTNLANFLNAQFTNSDGTAPAHPQKAFLTYTSADVQPAGIVLHGILFVQLWADPQIEFEQIPVAHVGAIQPIMEKDYSALKSWIPGGTITEFDWSWQGQSNPFEVDPNKFVLQQSGTVSTGGAHAYALTGYSQICLTVKGNRISNYGDFYEQISTQVCGVTRFNVGGLVGVLGGKAAAPMLAVTRSGPAGEVVVSGHATLQIDQSGNSSPNLIVHFADAKSASHLDHLTRALESSKRGDAPTAIIAVLRPGELSQAHSVPGIIYSDDPDGWSAALGLANEKHPLTAVLSPRGEVLWKHEGAPDADKLSSALHRHLVKRGTIPIWLPRLNSRVGQPAPNFLFEYAAGRQMPLTKLKGQDLTLIFWKSSVKSSIQAVRAIQASAEKGNSSGSMLLAINDGDSPEVARAVAAESGITATLVTDPKREVSVAYGVTMWPTIVKVSASGIITGVRFGFAPGENVAQGTAA